MHVRPQCSWSAAAAAEYRYLVISSSAYKVFVPRAPGAPLFTFDYLRDAGSRVPVAHLDVHAHRDEVVFAMLNAEGRKAKGVGVAEIADELGGDVRALHDFMFGQAVVAVGDIPANALSVPEDAMPKRPRLRLV